MYIFFFNFFTLLNKITYNIPQIKLTFKPTDKKYYITIVGISKTRLKYQSGMVSVVENY